jgi:hypothetical protein
MTGIEARITSLFAHLATDALLNVDLREQR